MEILSILAYFPVLVLYLFVSLFCGFFLCKFLKIEILQHFQTVVFLLVGLLFINTAYAIFVCKGITIMSGFAILGIISVPFFRTQAKITTTYFNFGDVLLLISLAAFWFLIYLSFYFFYFGNQEVVSSLHGDLLYYQKLGLLISETGNENTLGTINLYESTLKGAIQYHYLDIYIPEIIFKTIGGYPVKIHVLGACPLIMTIGSLLITSFSKFRNTSYWPALILFGSMLVFAGIDFGFSFKNHSKYVFPYLAGVELKIILPLIFILSSMFMFNLKMGTKSIIPLVALPFISFTYFPAVIAGLSCYLILGLLTRALSLRNFLIFFSLIIFTILFIIGFYKIFSVPSELSRMESVSMSKALSELISSPGLAIRIFAGSLLKFWLDYLPNILLIAMTLFFARVNLFSLKSNFLEIFLFSMFFLFGLAGWATLASFTVEAPQLFLLIQSNIVIALTILVVVNYHHRIKAIWSKTTILTLTLLYFVYLYTDKLQHHPFLFTSKSVSSKFANDVLDQVAKVYGKDNKNSKKVAFYCEMLRPEGNQPGYELLNFDRTLMFTSISPSIISGQFKQKLDRDFYVLEKDSMLSKDFITSPFFVYSKKKKSETEKTDMLTLQRAFIRENKIRFLFTKKEACEDDTGILNDFNFLYSDPISGTLFYEIKK